jgi:RNA-binding protein
VEALRGKDRRHLRGLANPLKAVVQVGEAGVTPGVIAATESALADHELIKVRIAADREERREVAEQIAGETGAELAGLIGRVAILYRAARDPEDRKIQLPSAKRSGA